MVIRSIVLDPGGAYVGAGGGITALSVPRGEVAEVGIKAAALLARARRPTLPVRLVTARTSGRLEAAPLSRDGSRHPASIESSRVTRRTTPDAADAGRRRGLRRRRASRQKWQAVWDELEAVPRRRRRATRGRASTCSTCSRTRRATCTWATPRRTRSATSSRATGASRASTCCTRSAGTPSACPPRTPPSSAASTRASGPTPTSRSRSAACKRYGASLRLGPRCCTPATPSTTSGTSGCS